MNLEDDDDDDELDDDDDDDRDAFPACLRRQWSV